MVCLPRADLQCSILTSTHTLKCDCNERAWFLFSLQSIYFILNNCYDTSHHPALPLQQHKHSWKLNASKILPLAYHSTISPKTMREKHKRYYLQYSTHFIAKRGLWWSTGNWFGSLFCHEEAIGSCVFQRRGTSTPTVILGLGLLWVVEDRSLLSCRTKMIHQ